MTSISSSKYGNQGSCRICCIRGWEELFLLSQEEFLSIANALERRRNEVSAILPKEDRILEAFKLCSYNHLKVVIVGEKPYSSEIATGIAFSTEGGIMTPSLRVISGWIEDPNFDPNLRRWCMQGVLLINAELTIEIGRDPVPHKVMWESFIRKCLEYCSRKGNIVFIFLGKISSEYSSSVLQGNCILKEIHPAAAARWGDNRKSKVFEEANEYLISKGKSKIYW